MTIGLTPCFNSFCLIRLVFIFLRCMCVISSVCTFPRVTTATSVALRRAAHSTKTLLCPSPSARHHLPIEIFAMSTVDSHLKALLALSGNEQLAGTRRHLIRGISDDELLEILKKGIGREFARGGLEDIVSVLLDVIARDSASVERSETTGSPAASFKDEDARGNTAQQDPEEAQEYSGQQQRESGRHRCLIID